MQHKLYRFHLHALRLRSIVSEEMLALFLVAVIFATPAAAAMRFQERSLFIKTNEPGVTTSYTVSFRYMSPASVGSVDMLFCVDPIPYRPCVTPPGLDVSNALLTDQSGETGFSILSKSQNRIRLSRTPALITDSLSSYSFTGIKNPTYQAKAFSIRLKSHSSTNTTGPQIDFGSVRAQIQKGIGLETQVPPMLIFCLAQEVSENCTDTNETYYTDLGQLSSDSTLSAQSQMAVGTNASAGFAITANGATMSAGNSSIDSLSNPAESQRGTNQFGINLVANDSPTIGNDPEGTWQNANPARGYGESNKYKYIPGDVIAYSPNVSLMKKFTVSYIVNSSEDLLPGVYSTTITYVASGRF